MPSQGGLAAAFPAPAAPPAAVRRDSRQRQFWFALVVCLRICMSEVDRMQIGLVNAYMTNRRFVVFLPRSSTCSPLPRSHVVGSPVTVVFQSGLFGSLFALLSFAFIYLRLCLKTRCSIDFGSAIFHVSASRVFCFVCFTMFLLLAN